MIYEGVLFTIGLFLIIDSLFYFHRLKEFKALVMGTMLLNFGFASFYAGFLISGRIESMSWMMGLENILSVLVAPTNVVLMIKSFWEREFVWEKSYSFLFLFPLLIVVILIPYYMLPEEAKTVLVLAITEQKSSFYTVFPLLAIVHYIMVVLTMFYINFSIYTKFNWKIATKKIQRKVLFSGIVITLYSLYILYCWKNHLFDPVTSWEEKGFSYCLYFFVTYWYFRFLQFWPYYFKYGMVFFDTKTFQIEKYFTNYLQNIDIDKLGKDLTELLEQQELYLDDSLSAAKLAKKLNISTHQLSAYLNQYLHQSFNRMINEKRIDVAKKILREDPKMKIIDVCYEVGFNSPSAFYRVFNEIVGTTPQKWQKKY